MAMAASTPSGGFRPADETILGNTASTHTTVTVPKASQRAENASERARDHRRPAIEPMPRAPKKTVIAKATSVQTASSPGRTASGRGFVPVNATKP